MLQQARGPTVEPMVRDAAKLLNGKVLKDALYVSVGLGLMAFQKAQVQRQELQKAVEARLKDAGIGR